MIFFGRLLETVLAWADKSLRRSIAVVVRVVRRPVVPMTRLRAMSNLRLISNNSYSEQLLLTVYYILFHFRATS